MGNSDALGGIATPVPAIDEATGARTARLAYILYLVGVVLPPTSIVAVFIAYLKMSDSPYWLQSHYCFQIRTFWIGTLLLLFGLLSTAVQVGYLVLLCWAAWMVVRCLKGLKVLARKEAYPNPIGWMC